MRCPNCNFENATTSTYCERCGTLLQNFTLYEAPEQTEYQAPSPPPLNGHNPPPPPPAYDYGEIPSILNTNESSQPNAYSTPPSYAIEPGGRSSLFYEAQNIRAAHISRRPGIFSGILYFLGDVIIVLGVFATLAVFDKNAITASIGILLSLATLIASIVFFIHLVRHHTSSLQWWHRILLLFGLAIAAFTLLVIVQLTTSSKFVNALVTGCMFVIYGLGWCAVAVW